MEMEGYKGYGNFSWRHYLISKFFILILLITIIHSPETILETGAKEKKRVYEQAVVERKGNFTPIVLSVDGLLHREAEHFLKRIAANLAHKWEKTYSQTCGYVRARLAFAIIRATRLHLRGPQVKWRSGLGMDDGALFCSLLKHA